MTETQSNPGTGQTEARLFDELLVILIQAGDRDAAERLAGRWHIRLARTANRLVGPALAPDAAQEAWLSIMRGLPGLRDPARFAPWAFNILRRRCADAANRAGREVSSAEPDDVGGPTPRLLDAMAITQAMSALPAPQRLAAHLYFIEGLTLPEIAEAKAVPLGTAKSRLFHARRHLKAALSGDD